MKIFSEFLIEALSFKQIRKFKKEILSKKYKNYLNSVFKNKDRIYFDFDINEKDINPPKDIDNFIKSNKLEIVDYKKGIVSKNDKFLKLGKILSKNKEFDLLKKFTNDKRRTGGKKINLLIVISRHPYDLAGMSTDRGWTSCMDIETGQLKRFIHKDIEYGSLVAYIIDVEDKNINKPISRILIKQFINMDDSKDIILYPEKKVYGASISGFRETIIKWLETFQKFKGHYKINPNLYNDTAELIGLGDKKSKDWEIRKLYYKNNPKDHDAKKDDYWEIRKLYYKNNPKDHDAKKDKSEEIRKLYYKNNPKDHDAKNDDYWEIRKLYYENNPKDHDAKKDDNSIIRKLYYKNNPKNIKEQKMKAFSDILTEINKNDGKDYQKFFKKTLKKYGVDEPDKLSKEDKKKFYNEIDAGWKADKEKD